MRTIIPKIKMTFRDEINSLESELILTCSSNDFFISSINNNDSFCFSLTKKQAEELCLTIKKHFLSGNPNTGCDGSIV